jgi:hypothetical protein
MSAGLARAAVVPALPYGSAGDRIRSSRGLSVPIPCSGGAFAVGRVAVLDRGSAHGVRPRFRDLGTHAPRQELERHRHDRAAHHERTLRSCSYPIYTGLLLNFACVGTWRMRGVVVFALGPARYGPNCLRDAGCASSLERSIKGMQRVLVPFVPELPDAMTNRFNSYPGQ